jgi:hypothetical protein
MTDDPAAAIRATLGARVTSEPLPTANGWRCEEPISPETPIGPIARLVALASDSPHTLRFVPGSQGCSLPPDDGDAIEMVHIGAASTLLLDARCWYDAHPNIRASLWSSLPGVHS